MNTLKKLKIAVLVSGNGSNLQVLIDQMQQGDLPIEIACVISNKSDAYALVRAKNANIQTFVIDKDEHGKKYTRTGFEEKALSVLANFELDLLVLAGFMRILTPVFIEGVSAWHIPMINLHPSLLPNYKGLDTHQRVLVAGERYHGCSVHLVTCELDAGDVLTQALLCVSHGDTQESLQKRVQQLEHQLVPLTLKMIAGGLIDLSNSQPISPYRFWFD